MSSTHSSAQSSRPPGRPPAASASAASRRAARVARRAGALVVVPLLLLAMALLLMPQAALARPLSGTGAAVTISPESGPVGARLTVSGEHFRAHAPLQVGYSSSGDCSSMTAINGATGTAGSDGSVTIGVTWPMTGQGTFTVCVQDTNSGKAYPSNNPYQVLSAAAPAITISPSPVGSQGQVTVKGANFLPGGGSVEVLWGAQASGGGAALSDICANSVGKPTNANGSFTISFKAPYTGSNLPITIIAVSPAGSCGQQPILSAQQNVMVTGAGVATATIVATPGKSPLITPTWPPTGIWSVVYCLIGLLLFLLLLLALLVASRNRNKNQPAVVQQGQQGQQAGQGGRLMGSTRVSYGSDGRPIATEQMYTQGRRGGSTQVADMGGGEDMPPLQGSGGNPRTPRYGPQP